MPTKVDDLAEQLKSCLTSIRGLADAADAEDRDFTDDERATVTAKMAEAKDLRVKLDNAKSDGAVRKAIRDLGDGFGLTEPKPHVRPDGLIVPDGQKSIGELFVGSAEYKALMESVPGGVFTKQHRVQSRPVGFTHLTRNPRGSKALVTGASDTSAGSLVVNDYLGLRVGLDAFQRPLTIRDLVTPGTTQSDTVEYVRVTGVTNNAAPVAEATTTSNGTKPESGLTLAKVTTPVRTIAHWIPVTKRALSDAAQIRTLIDAYLEYGLEEELEDQVVSGDGVGENFEGLATVSGTQTQAWDTNIFTTTRRAKTKVRLVGRSIPTAYVLNPADVETMDLLQDNEARYYRGGPIGTVGGNLGTAPLWDLPVIESEAVPAGTGWVGDWRKAIIWDREQSSITMSDSHANFFVQNLVALLCEMRAAFGVIQPSAFVEIDLTA
ncbi:phage major capsid protein [Lentzea sp. JNUCC 0626]|uniref:phage major capsid protein n=1 Tax=Lentzea sp. JNUCC 0626 TaxID=3367513 RepID=UPI00374A0F71